MEAFDAALPAFCEALEECKQLMLSKGYEPRKVPKKHWLADLAEAKDRIMDAG